MDTTDLKLGHQITWKKRTVSSGSEQLHRILVNIGGIQRRLAGNHISPERRTRLNVELARQSAAAGNLAAKLDHRVSAA